MSSKESGVYDIIFAGGGASACITAGRLAEADPDLKILIVEAGPHTRAIPDNVQPARFFSTLARTAETYTFHVSKPSKALLGRSSVVPTGRAVGGGSSVNFMVYNRAAASDYDDWETIHGNKGWGSSDLIPLLQKAETYQENSTNNTHGTSGPIKVSFAPNLYNIAENFLEVAVAIDNDRPLTEDISDFATVNRHGRLARYIDAQTGKRSDTAHHYVYNQERNTNLEILVKHRVVRVLFEGTRATGIEYVDDSVGRNGGDTIRKISRASQLVVLSGGTFGTPAILERSGIGEKSILEKNNIIQLVDLPGVGEHYIDHNAIFLPFIASEETDTLDHIFRGPEDSIASEEKKWLETGQGLMAHNSLDAAVKLRPNAKELAKLSPEFDHRWQSYFVNAPDKPVLTVALLAAYVGLDPTIPLGKYFSVGYYTSYPVAVGRVHITSGNDPYAILDFETGYLEDPADVAVLRWGYKRAREYARRFKYYRGELAVAHPQFKPGSAAVPNLVASPVDVSAPDIIYSAEDDEAIDQYTRKIVETTWHPLGTCAMKPRYQGGVVDERLNVYGVQGLKIADCSIPPDNVGANTYSTAIAIGEKAAVIIAEDLGIKGVSAA